MRHNTTLIILSLLTALVWNSCENYRDNNGDFGGMWQLTQWQTCSNSGLIDSTIATNEDGIYYSVQRDLMQIYQANDTINTTGTRVFASFKLTADSLLIYNLVHANDSSVTNSTKHQYGIPFDGKYHLDALTPDNMILSYKDNRLTFRKY